MNIAEIITELNIARSNDCSKEKSEEIKKIIQELLPYQEVNEVDNKVIALFKRIPPVNTFFFVDREWDKYKAEFEKDGIEPILTYDEFMTLKEWCKPLYSKEGGTHLQ